MWTVSSRLRKEKMALGAGGGRERSRVAGAEVRERGASKSAGRAAGMRGLPAGMRGQRLRERVRSAYQPHQASVLFSQNKPATSNQPTVLLSQNKLAPAISHQPNEQARRRKHGVMMTFGTHLRACIE
jgi:hypothetical protein